MERLIRKLLEAIALHYMYARLGRHRWQTLTNVKEQTLRTNINAEPLHRFRHGNY